MFVVTVPSLVSLRRLIVLAVLAASVSAAAPAGAAPYASRTLVPGLSGKDVRTVQVLLRRATEQQIAIDGRYGPQTQRVARMYEVANRLGVNGKLTRGEQRLLRDIADRAVAERRVAAALPVPEPVPEAIPAPAPASVPVAPATLNPDGTATAPPGAPPQVVAFIAAANEIATLPYRYGGGHAKLVDTGYDCSGSVSYALRGAGLMAGSMPSWGFEPWGEAGPGTWITIYAHKSHMYAVVAGLRFDTSGARPSRWQAAPRSAAGFTVRHPPGL